MPLGAPARARATTASTRSSTTPRFLIPGQDVKIAGARVGAVIDVQLTPDHKARVEMEVDERFAPVPHGRRLHDPRRSR